jgi:Right handed beta helix region
MRIQLPLCLMAAVMASGFAAVAPANAAITSALTFVSGQTGSDANANSTNLCSQATPCKTLSAALNVTSAGGVLSCLDTTTTFGAVVISSDVTIDCSGTYGAIFASGFAGVRINSTAKVVLRGLTIYSAGGSNGTVGVDIVANAIVSIEKCKIFGFTTAGSQSGAGVYVESPAEVDIRDSVIESNAGAGVGVIAASGDVKLKIQDSTINNNAGGIALKPSGGASVEAAIVRTHVDKNIGGGLRADSTNGGFVTVSAADSSFSLNGANGVNAVSNGSASVTVNLAHDLIASNGLTGVQSNGAFATVTVSGSTLGDNAQAWSIVSGASLLSYQNNQVTGPTGSTPGAASFQ